MIIDLSKLDFTFQCKPLLIGGKAMEHYELGQAGADIDFVITAEDYQRWIVAAFDEETPPGRVAWLGPWRESPRGGHL